MLYHVFYTATPEAGRSLCMGWEFALEMDQKYPDSPEHYKAASDMLREDEDGNVFISLEETHRPVAMIQANHIEDIYMAMQGEMWSPRGEARDLIRMTGVGHTSMSVGDVVVDEDGTVFMVDNIGFTKLGRRV